MSNGMRLCAQGARGMDRFSPNSFRSIASRIYSLLERVFMQDLTPALRGLGLLILNFLQQALRRVFASRLLLTKW